MKESEAWLILAEEHDEGRTGTFLCLTLGGWSESKTAKNPRVNSIPYALRRQMITTIRSWMGYYDEGRTVAYGDPNDPKSVMTDEEERAGRVTACLVFAAIAKSNRPEYEWR